MYKNINILFYVLRDKKDNLFKPVAAITPLWLSPNLISTLRLTIAFFLFYLWIFFNNNRGEDLIFETIAGSFLVFIGLLSDLLDGACARSKNNSSSFGMFYDSIVDKIFIMPVSLLIAFYFPVISVSMMFLYFFKVFQILIILLKVLLFNGIENDTFQKFYLYTSFAGYIILLSIIVVDLN